MSWLATGPWPWSRAMAMAMAMALAMWDSLGRGMAGAWDMGGVRELFGKKFRSLKRNNKILLSWLS